MSDSTTLNEASGDFQSAQPQKTAARTIAGLRAGLRLGERGLWFSFERPGGATLAVRAVHAAEGLTIVGHTRDQRGGTLDLTAASARYRVTYRFPVGRRRVVRISTWMTPVAELKIPFAPRDFYVFGTKPSANTTAGDIHTAQRGPRTGIVFATAREPKGATFLYWQNFTALNDFSKKTHTSPAGCVGGEWPEMGYAPAPVTEHALAPDCEVQISDVHLALEKELPASDYDAARLYLDMMADIYVELERPQPDFHFWPEKAQATMRDLSFSPKCSHIKQNARFVMPYVGDSKKPPESMVQLAVLLPMLEFEEWSGQRFVLSRRLLESLPKFFDSSVGSIVRWLPGERFPKTQETGMKHENMDSWYLYHILFNVSRLATLGNVQAKSVLRKSLPYAIRVAQRFDYRWPVFFDTKTLEVVRGETEPGAGGEHDVAGLYALVMMQAHEIFKEARYLEEAQRAAKGLENLGFRLGYQTNTIGFAAEAMLKLYRITKEQQYLDLAEVCFANLFDNMWIWQCSYGYAIHYNTFFGLLPLRDAPYLACYEELEVIAKFHDVLRMAGDDLRPSLRLLLAEYGKYALGRVWQYFPASLPADGLSEKQESGELNKALSVPVEDLQDGWKKSGSVGQEIYGAGVALVYTTRQFKKLGESGVMLFCEYPIVDLDITRNRAGFTVGGSAALGCKLRLVPSDPSCVAPPFTVRSTKQLKGELSSEGHLCFEVRGGDRISIAW
ncbi:MAG: hypothetical protein ABR584_08060 [Candidatus Baltobacteraceae bacterium]